MEELSRAQTEELRRDLEELSAGLGAQLESTREGARPVSLDQPIGRLSRMAAIQQQEMAQAGRRGMEVRLRQVKAALASLGEGDYGICRSCEEPIGYSRLKARPETPYCLHCQASRERGE